MLKAIYFNPNEIGTDEAGRGCLAGPVTAAAIVLPEAFENVLINDSKMLSGAKRAFLKPILEEAALAFGVAHVSPEAIDDLNILNASILAMHQAIDQIIIPAHYIIVDGNKFKPYKNFTHECIIKGDSKYLRIAAASILAKTHRDELMNILHLEYPMYNWKQNKGYPTKEHRAAIRKYGITKYHRKSFRLYEIRNEK
jgi:ribonuclease HII